MSEWVDVILFRRNGKYYTQERWRIPEVVKDWSEQRGHFERKAIGPYDMTDSPDFRRIDGGAVLVDTQEPWGYPHLFPGLPPGKTDEPKPEPIETPEPKFIRGVDGDWIAVAHIVAIGKAYRDPHLDQDVHVVSTTHQFHFAVSAEEIARIVK